MRAIKNGPSSFLSWQRNIQPAGKGRERKTKACAGASDGVTVALVSRTVGLPDCVGVGVGVGGGVLREWWEVG